MNPTKKQLDYLLDFLQQNQELALGRSKTSEGRAQTKLLWERLTNELNSLEGCSKTIKQWQKVWADKKYLAKKAAAAVEKSATITSGGELTTPNLTFTERRIINIIGKGLCEPKIAAQHVENVTNQPADPDDKPPSKAQIPTSLKACNSKNRTRKFRRLANHSLRTWLVQMEEDRIAIERQRGVELRRIRETLIELNKNSVKTRETLNNMCGLLRELIDEVKKNR